MAPSIAIRAIDGTARALMDSGCELIEGSTYHPTPTDLLRRAEAACENAPSRTTGIPSPYPDSYEYCGIKANTMYYGGGNGEWGNSVRGCLPCMDDYEVAPHDAHMYCYERATRQTENFLSTIRGYGEAVVQGGAGLLQKGWNWLTK